MLAYANEHTKLKRFEEGMDQVLGGLHDLKDVQAIIGIPFHNETETLGGVISAARAGLEKMGLSSKSIVLCTGPERGRHTFDEVIKQVGADGGVPAKVLLLNHAFDGRGWSIRAMMMAATKLRAPLVLLPPNLLPTKCSDDSGSAPVVCTTCFSAEWIEHLLTPIINEDQDLALARFNRHPLDQPVESFLAFPVIAAVFGFRLRQPTPGVFAMSKRLIHMCLAAHDMWASKTGAYGFDAWLVMRALIEDLDICEVPLGAVCFRREAGNLKQVFHQVAHTVLNVVALHDNWWLDRTGPFRSASVSGPRVDLPPLDYDLRSDQLKHRFKVEFNHFDETLYRAIVPDELRERMEKQCDVGAEGAILTPDEWIFTLRRFLLAYRFEDQFHPDDIVDGLFPFFLARLVSYVDEYHGMKEHLVASKQLDLSEARHIARHEAERIIQKQTEMFVAAWPEFHGSWLEREKAVSSYLPRLGAWQFIPGVDVIVPQEIETPDGRSVWAYQVYKDQIDANREQFKELISAHLSIDDYNRSAEIIEGVEGFMYRLDRLIDTEVLPYDITTVKGAGKAADIICKHFIKEKCFCLTRDAAENIVLQAPPRGLITRLDLDNVRGLLDRYEPNAALGLAAWTDRYPYLSRVLDIIERDGDASWFESTDIKPILINIQHLANATEVGGSTALARLAGRVMVSNKQHGSGQKLPKLWYMLRLIKAIVGVELFSQIWRGFADEGFDFGSRLALSIQGHWGRQVMSAHNAFENKHQRILVERLQLFADELAKKGGELATVAKVLKAASDAYHLSIMLPDATFVPLSAWTWASYSARGGVGLPTPLSSLVERDWATRDFLTEYLERTGLGGEATIDKTIVQLIGQGKESEDLREHLFGVEVNPDELIVAQKPRAEPPQAAKMQRPLDHPLLEPIKEHAWESRYVLNAAAFRLQGNVYILYRAFGDDKISRIGMAWSRDGINIDGRLDKPIFEPGDDTERDGCEDPRVVIIDGRLWMLYTAWNVKVAQIALASISVEDFLAGRFDAWERHGLGFPGLANKDAVLYPEKINGRYALYHRLDPNLWVTYMDDLTCPFPREGHQIIISPRPGMMWDGVKLGAGAQPIKTTKGWLNIYHGVDYMRSYRLGVLFTPLDDPATILYRSPNSVLQPETDYELGSMEGQDSWVPHVVFTCGAVPEEDKEIIGPDDHVLVYYGAADTVMGVARACLRDLVPVWDSL